jgi:hypothetical protein
VVDTSAWPSSSCTVRMSEPRSSRCVANECMTAHVFRDARLDRCLLYTADEVVQEPDHVNQVRACGGFLILGCNACLNAGSGLPDDRSANRIWRSGAPQLWCELTKFRPKAVNETAINESTLDIKLGALRWLGPLTQTAL